MIGLGTSVTKYRIVALGQSVRKLEHRADIEAAGNTAFFAYLKWTCNLKRLAFVGDGPQQIEIVIAIFQPHCCRQLYDLSSGVQIQDHLASEVKICLKNALLSILT